MFKTPLSKEVSFEMNEPLVMEMPKDYVSSAGVKPGPRADLPRRQALRARHLTSKLA